MTQPAASSTIEFTTSDGVTLTGDLAIPDDPSIATIICHPHPQYGGNRHNNVVEALFDEFRGSGLAALRFDFRRVFDGGRGELLDAAAAIDVVAAAAPNATIVAAGYSFGATIALGLDDERIGGKVLIAPPLAVMSVAPGVEVPTLVLTPEHDQFSPPDASGPIVTAWDSTTHEIIESADHFLAGATQAAATRAVEWVAATIDQPERNPG